MTRLQLTQLRFQVRADTGDVRQQAAVNEFLEEHEGGAAREKIAAVRAAVVPEGGRCGHPLAEQRRRNRHTGSK